MSNGVVFKRSSVIRLGGDWSSSSWFPFPEARVPIFWCLGYNLLAPVSNFTQRSALIQHHLSLGSHSNSYHAHYFATAT